MAEVKDRVSIVEDGEDFIGNITKISGKECTVKWDNVDEPETVRIASLTIVKVAADIAAEEAKAKEEADAKAEAEEAEAKKKAEEEAAKKKDDEDDIEDSISVPKSKVDLRKFNGQGDDKKMAAENKKQEGLSAKRRVNRIQKIKDAATKKPIEARRDYLTARLKGVKGRTSTQFPKEQVNMWAKELLIITDDPEAWRPGCVKPKKQPSALDKLDKVLRV